MRGAVNPDSAEAWVEVNDACSFDDDYSSTFNISAMNGTTGNTESMNRVNPPSAGDNLVHVSCNNISGFSIKAIGYSPDATHTTGYDGNTDMYSSTTSAVISTGTATSGATSAWAMKITSATNDVVTTTSGVTYPNGYQNTYGVVPSSATTVLHFAGSTSAVVTGSFRPDYQYYISQSQPAGTYTGKVKYTIIGD